MLKFVQPLADHVADIEIGFAMCRKVIQVPLVVLFVVLSLICPPVVAHAAEADSWTLSIGSVETKSELHTTKTYEDYDGNPYVQQFDDVPADGYCYAIVSISVSKNASARDAELAIGDVTLTVDDASYNAVAPISSFLSNHDFDTFTGDSIISTQRGYVAFEIPVSYLDSDGTGWRVSCGDFQSADFAPLGNEVERRSDYVDSQAELESNALQSYELAGKATIDDPFVIRDLYGNAPLTAVAMFETDSTEQVTVTVHGKNGSEGDISYPVSGESTHHEVPIFGLYAGYDNIVTISTPTKSCDITITTQALPDSVEYVDKVGSYGSQQIGQLFVLQAPHQVVFDIEGEVRWYMTDTWSCKTLVCDSSYPMQIASDGSSFWFFRNRQTTASNNSGCELVHMTWMGKVEKLISPNGYTCDHDFAVVGDSVYFIDDGMSTSATINKLDLNTGNVEEFLKLSDLLDLDALPSYLNAWDDPWHINAIQYIEEDNSFILSIRNQSLVLKIDAETADVLWAFTSASGTNSDGSRWARQVALSDYVVLPDSSDKSFEWFYDQHDANVVSYDAERGVIQIALFDNGTYRYNYGDQSNDKKYSRIVVYEIDETSMTAKQIRSFDKNQTSDLYSWWYGSARVLDNGHMVGNFGCYKSTNNTHILEVDENDQLVAEYQVNRAQNGSYRTTMLDTSGAFENLALGSETGSEIHVYAESYWKSCSLGDVSELPSLNLSELFRDNDSISILGKVGVSNPGPIEGINLILSGEAGTFKRSLIIAGTRGKFYGLGLSTSSLNDGTYSLYLQVVMKDGSSVTQSLDKSLTVGASASETVASSTNIPDTSQESITESLVSSALGSTFDQMTVVQDPYGISPLTAMACFSTDDLCSISVTAHGKDASDDVSYGVDGSRVLHTVPIIGLYYNDTTEVTIVATHSDGTTETKVLSLSTGTASNQNKIPNIEVSYADEDSSLIADGLTFCAPSGGSYFYAIDKTGAIRWYYSYSGNLGMDGVSFTQSNHLLILDGSKSASAETNSFSAQEIDLLGRVYNSYFLPNMSFHHELKELPSGNLLASATDYTKDTINDVIVEIDRSTGEIVRRWDMDEILGRYGIDRLATPSFELTELTDEDGNAYNENWFHNNCVVYDESDDSLIVSSRHQSAVFKIDASTGDVRWVLSDHNCYAGTGLEPYLLNPVDENDNAVDNDDFAWQYGQHAAMICSDGDIALFDNGNYRTKLDIDRTLAADNYSRVVKFHVDEENMTVSLVSEFGKEYGSEHFCALIGDVDELGEGHYLDTFGGHCLTGPGGDVSDSAGAPYIESSLFEVLDGEVIWQMSSTPNLPVRSSAIYRGERVNLTKLAYTYDSSYGQQWLGDAGAYPTVSLDANSFSEGLSNVSISKVINEGNRLVVSGTVTNPLSINELYLGETVDGSEVYHKIDISSNGSFTVRMTLDSSTIGDTRTLRLYAVMFNDMRLYKDVDYESSGLHTFSAKISGETCLNVGDESSYTLILSPWATTDTAATWSSSDYDVVAVDANGKATAKSAGVAVLTALSSDNGTSAQMVVTVLGSSVKNDSVCLRRNETYAIDVSSLGASAGKLQWTSSDTGVARVDEGGVITAIEPGNCTVSAEVDGKELSIAVKVASTLTDGVYTIASKLDESMVLDISGADHANGANVQLYKDNASNAQQFRFTYVGEGMYTINSLCSDKVLDVADAGMSSGTNVWQYEDNGTLAQRWYVDLNKDGSWTITSALNGLVLDVSGASRANGTNIQVYGSNGTAAQRFNLTKRFEDGIYRIATALDDSMTLDVDGAATGQANVQVWNWNRTSAQLALIRYAGEGAYEIRFLCSGCALDVAGASMDSGANVQVYPANGTAAQRWYIRVQTDGSYRIVSALSGKCLEVGGSSQGGNVFVSNQSNSKAQLFELKSAGETVSLQSSIDAAYCLDVSGASSASGANVQLYGSNGTSAQKFYMSEALSDGSRFILPLTGPNALDVSNGSHESGANVQQWEVNGTAAQRWFVSNAGSGFSTIRNVASGNALDVSNGIARNSQNVQVWGFNNTAAQRFIVQNLSDSAKRDIQAVCVEE